MTDAQDVIDGHKARAAQRDVWRPLWQDLADNLQPNHGGFVRPIIPGQETQQEIYDTTPQQARRGLATAIDGLMKPATSRWFWMSAKEDDLNDNDDAKLWFDQVGDLMWTSIYNPLARFIQHSGAVDNDLATFGIGYLWIGENRSRDGLTFHSLPIADCAIEENADTQVDTISIERRYTARQAKQRFKIIPPCVQEALRNNTPDSSKKLFSFIQEIRPREERDTGKRDNLNFPFANVVVSVEDKTIVEESGFQEFPVAVPRWETVPGEIYPRSPGMIALPDSRTLQAMGRTLLIGGQRAVDPPTWVADDAALSIVRTHPGGLSVFDADAIARSGGKPIGQLEMGAQIPIGREMQDDYRKMVGSAFFSDVFALPQDQNMTATEVMARKEEFLRKIGPTLGQLENDYIGVIVRRVFGLMLRAGAFPVPPDVLRGRSVEFEFMSPIQQAKRQVETAGWSRALEMVQPLLQVRPDLIGKFDGEEIIDDMPDITGIPERWIVSKDKFAAQQQARAAAQAQDGALQQGQQVADVLKTAADAHHAAARGTAVAQQATQQAVPA